jgi:hypothetical protein
MKLFILLLVQVIIDAFDDSLAQKIRMNSKASLSKLHHAVQSIHILVWLSIIACLLTNFISPWNASDYTIFGITIPAKTNIWIQLILGYSFLRFAIFDYSFNLFAGRTRSYFGKSSIYDIVLGTIAVLISKTPFIKKMPPSFMMWVVFVIRFVCIFQAYKVFNNLTT